MSRWLVEDGDAVAAGQLVVEVETDKATVEIEAPAAGVLRIVAAEGAIVAVDGVLAELEPAAPEPAEAADERRRQPAPRRRPVARVARAVGGAGQPCVAAPRGQGRSHHPLLAGSPASEGSSSRPCRARARRADRGARRRRRRRPRSGHAGAGGGRPPPRGRRANITASWQQIPHVHIGGELAADGVMRARASAPPEAAVTVTDLLVVALARALAEVPELNALRRADGSVERSAARAPLDRRRDRGGVVAPVLRDAGSLTLGDVARERRRLVEAARQGTLDGRDLAGGTCTLSNLGAHPVDFFAPVVSGPQVAMVATGRVADRPVAVDGLVGVRPRMWVNVAIDHRAADGEAGGRLLAALERQIALLPGGPA